MTTTKTETSAPAAAFTAGLEDIIAGSTRKSLVDGDQGKLAYCGYSIEQLAEQGTFEETIFLLWNERLPTKAELAAFRAELAGLRQVPDDLWALLKPVASRLSLMDLIRSGTSLLAAWDADVKSTMDVNPERPRLEMAISKRLMAMIGTLVAGCWRLQKGQAPLAPRADLSYAGNYLYMVGGKEPNAYEERIFDAALVLHADHGFNASTFAARVTAGTESDIYSAIVAAIGTLAGRLHGGANERVFYMLEKIGDIASVDAFVDKVLSQPKGRVMGFGHRVYKVEDPRATVLRKMAKELTHKAGHAKWFEMSLRIEERVVSKKHIYPNVDFYSASVYASLGLEPVTFTPIFAVSRMSGWLAHVLEQHADNRLIRPESQYVGPPLKPYVPVDRR